MQPRMLKYLPAIGLLYLVSCSKTAINPPGTASLTFINAVVGADTLVTNFSGTAMLENYYINANLVIYNFFVASDWSVGNKNQVRSYSGTQQVALYKYPDTLPKSKPLFNLSLGLPVGSINSLFLTGTMNAPDTLFTRDYLRNYSSHDSTTGIRFVNISPGSTPISVNLEGHPFGSEASSLPYKNITSFKDYAATSNISSYNFEFRDATTGALLATYLADGINQSSTSHPLWPTNKWRYRNSTLALLGLPGGSGATAQKVLLINHY